MVRKCSDDKNSDCQKVLVALILQLINANKNKQSSIYNQHYAIDLGRSPFLKAGEGGANKSSSGEAGGGAYDLGLSPGCTLLLKEGDGGTNNVCSGEPVEGA